MLINCPKCGKPISDKAKTCPHCNEVFAGVIEKESRQTVDYMSLSKDKWLSLAEEFAKEDPAHGDMILNSEKSRKKTNVLSALTMFFAIFSMVLLYFVDGDDFSFLSVILIVGVIGLLVTFIIFMVMVSKTKKNNQQLLKAFKYHELWLKKKGIENFQISFANEKFKAAYNNIKIEDGEKGE